MNDFLQVQGRMTMGYGIIPKMVMKDTRLTIEAKSIYAYFCSFAGAGTTAFPSRDKLLYDLQIGKDRFYKHFNLLKTYGYIEVKQNVESTGKFKNNIYTLIEMIDPCHQNKDTVKNPCHDFRDTDKSYTENKDTNNNNLKINNLKNQQSSQSQTGQMTLTMKTNKVIIEDDIKKRHFQDATNQSNELKNTFINTTNYITYEKIIKDNIEYNHLIHNKRIEKTIVDELITCMLDVICTNEPTVKINGENKNRELVKSVYLKIDSMNIEHIIDKYKGIEHKITHKSDYLKTMLYNIKQEYNAHYTNLVNQHKLNQFIKEERGIKNG